MGTLGSGPQKPCIDDLFEFVRNVMRNRTLSDEFIKHCDDVDVRAKYGTAPGAGSDIVSWLKKGGSDHAPIFDE